MTTFKLPSSAESGKKPHGLFCTELVPYGDALWWSFAPTPSQFLVEFNRTFVKHGFKPKPIPRGSHGHTEIFIKDGIYYPVIWVNNPAEPWILAHELEHFVHWYFNEKGLTYTESSEEAYAYMIGHLMKLMLLNSKLDLPLKVGR